MRLKKKLYKPLKKKKLLQNFRTFYVLLINLYIIQIIHFTMYFS